MPSKYTPEQRIDAFWNKVDLSNVDSEFACLEWTASRNQKGYGLLANTGKWQSAHRVAWAYAFGEIPLGLWVLHHCDNPSCVNPNHLFLGTNQDNVDDKISKGRQKNPIPQRGENHPFHKLSDLQVSTIRQRYADGHKAWGLQTRLAEEYGVGQAIISAIVRNVKRKS